MGAQPCMTMPRPQWGRPARPFAVPALAALAAAAVVAAAAALLLALPAVAGGEAYAQESDRIALLAGPGEYERGDAFFVFGRLAQVDDGSYLVIQAFNPQGNICRIQQIAPLSGGQFLSEAIPLTGRACGVPGEYDVRLFYGDERASVSFTLSPVLREAPSASSQLEAARSIARERIDSLAGGDTAAASSYVARLAAPGLTVQDAAEIYADAWAALDSDGEAIYSVGASFRPAVESTLSATSRLVAAGDLSATVASEIDAGAYEAAFYHALGETAAAVSRLSDALVSVQNVDPVKVEAAKPRTYAELEQSVQNLMTKTSATLSGEVKEELALIFARGTAPLYADELDEMLDMLTKMRFLDIASRRNSTLYSIVQDRWAPLGESLALRPDMASLLSSHEEVDGLHRAALILRDLDGVGRFMGTHGQPPTAPGAPPPAGIDRGALVEIVRPDWDRLAGDMESASTVGDILASERRASDMKSVIEISGRITKVVEIARENGAGSDMVAGWEDLLKRARAAGSVRDMLPIVSEFDASLAELRERRSPVESLRFDYESMLARAEMQADHDNTAKIRTALRILDSAAALEKGNPSASRIDRIEVLLAWASESAPTIRAELEAYSDDAYDLRAGDILRRAKSIEDLLDVSMRGNRFAPGFADFASSIESRLEDARNMVVAGELDGADAAVRALFDEWQAVSGAYAEDPPGAGEAGHSIEGLKRADIRGRLGALAEAASNFYSADFAPHAAEYERLRDAAYEAADYGNFVDAEERLAELGAFLEAHLASTDPRIIYEIDYDGGHDTWVLSGHLDKSSPLREKITVTVYRGDASVHSGLRFTDTREGAFYTQWRAPAEPGLYVVMLEWSGSSASRLLYVADEPSFEYSPADADASDVAREFAELESFAERFGSAGAMARVEPIMSDIRAALESGGAGRAAGKLGELRAAIDRYLPERSRAAVIDAQYASGQLVVSGAVLKTLDVSEDLFVDVYDQAGSRVHEIALRDSASGHFSEAAAVALPPGIYVVELHYHDLSTTDFFIVGGR